MRRACTTFAALATTVLPAASSAHASAHHHVHARSAGSRILFQTWYPASGDAAQIPETGWHADQIPDDDGHHEDSRISFVEAPGAGHAHRPSGPVARFTLHPFHTHGSVIGDETDTGGDVANRVEVYGRIATRDTPAARWPDPVGSTRWYAFNIYIPRHFPTATRDTRWFDFVQWKGLRSGSPPVAMEIRGTHFYLGGKHGHSRLGNIERGRWTRFVVGLHFSDSKRSGWATVYRNGRRLVHHRPTKTMNEARVDGRLGVDPNYLKMGIYRSVTWRRIQTIYLSSLRIGTTHASVS